MATELGIGVRVWTGWIPDSEVQAELRERTNPRCRIAVIRDGPIHCIRRIRISEGRLRPEPIVCWVIEFEDDGDTCLAEESVLYPIDDWDENLNRREDVDTSTPKEVVWQPS